MSLPAAYEANLKWHDAEDEVHVAARLYLVSPTDDNHKRMTEACLGLIDALEDVVIVTSPAHEPFPGAREEPAARPVFTLLRGGVR
jgi:hypothetical protein